MNANNPLPDPFDIITDELFSFEKESKNLNFYLWSDGNKIQWSDGSFANY